MKKLLSLLMLAIFATSASAYYIDYDYVNPYYNQYFEGHGFLNDPKYSEAIERWHYQEAMSPYFLVRSPYGKRPWIKPYGEGYPRLETESDINAFYGFAYTRFYHCHGPSACHYHNIFPGS